MALGVRCLYLAAILGCCACGEASDLALSSSPHSRDKLDESPAHPTDVPAPRVYFSPFDDAEGVVLNTLDEAQYEVLIAHYNIRSQPILHKLIALANRGVAVRVAVDERNANKSWNTGDDYLEAAGIELLRTKPEHPWALMHLKTCVIDHRITMTGSFNWNETAARSNEENMFVFRNPAIATHYRNQILDILNDEPHVVEAGELTPTVAVHFSPEERLQERIVSAIDQAQESIDLAMFILTEHSVGDALLRAIDRGVDVRVVIEAKMAHYSRIDEALENSGALLIRGANSLTTHSAMHVKYCIIDGTTLLTGAANWTRNGTTRSDEDLIIIADHNLIADHQEHFADLMYIYGNVSQGQSRPNTPVLFRAIVDHTQYGDRVVLVGSPPELGLWDPNKGIELHTSSSSYPNWSVTGQLPAGSELSYKFVILRADGSVEWEPGQNRHFGLSPSGRAAVVSGTFGDTTTSWCPADEV